MVAIPDIKKNCQVAIRVDASLQMGSGHVMRCLTLAEELRRRSAEISFICRKHDGHLCHLIEQRGFVVLALPKGSAADNQNWNRHAEWLQVSRDQDARQTIGALEGQQFIDWLIIDHYAIDQRWETSLRPVTHNIMVIDDLADRQHDCELLLDQNYFCDFEQRYEGLVPDHCQKLLGPRYSLLRPEFRSARVKLRQRTGTVKNILVFFGGTDPTDETVKALRAIQSLNLDDINIDVVVGIGNQSQDRILQLSNTLPQAQFYCQVDNMAELLARADLALGAGGSTNWERFALGTPALLIAVADNQEKHAQDLADRGLVGYLGRSDQVDKERIAEQLDNWLRSPGPLSEMISSGMKLVDGMGTRRVAEHLLPKSGERDVSAQ